MQTMNDIQMLSALKLPWDAISRYLETLISAILGRSFTCSTKGENDDYWRTSVLCDTFTNVEIVRLVNAVNGDDNMLRHALPVDSTVSRSLEMGLCQALLKRALKLDWENEFVSPDCVLRRSSTFCLPHPAAPATRIPKGLSYPGSVRNRKTMLPSA